MIGYTVNKETARRGWGAPRCRHRPGSAVEAVGVDESLFAKRGRYRAKQWSISVVDVGNHQLIDIIPGRTAKAVENWFLTLPEEWRKRIRWAVPGHVRPPTAKPMTRC